ncbi:hypothetical protein [Anaerobacillus alkaliphilus]|uniref:hypothetical protein n=1 Tax=Anaerobacillus alkaliphilus TaxID=1548597 RepID=UPI00137630E8|nr:hypothetical protein [Anaerobacillus alkaliphilus]
MNLDHLTQSILELANRLIGTRTFFVSMIDNDKYTILKVVNNNGSNIVEGLETPFHQTL